jgi:hypothetical protein
MGEDERGGRGNGAFTEGGGDRELGDAGEGSVALTVKDAVRPTRVGTQGVGVIGNTEARDRHSFPLIQPCKPLFLVFIRCADGRYGQLLLSTKLRADTRPD